MRIKIRNTYINCGAVLVCALAVALMSALQYISYDISAGVAFANFLGRRISAYLFGCGFPLMLTSFCMLITGRLAVSCAVSSILCAAFSVVNHFVYIYSGQPLLLSMVTVAGTALDVVGRYSFSMDRTVAAIVGIFLLNAGLCLVLKRSAQKDSLLRNKKFLRAAGLCCAVLMTAGVARTIRETRRWGWIANLNAWVRKDGYTLWALTDSYLCFQNPLRTPPGYSADEVRKLADVRGGGYISSC